jgi:hypothetical protein
VACFCSIASSGGSAFADQHDVFSLGDELQFGEGANLFAVDTRLQGMWEHTRKITHRQPCEPDREGDDRVPLASAQLEDVQTRYVKGEHSSLPDIPAVAQDVLAWLSGGTLRLDQTCQGALGGHISAEEGSSVAPLLDGSTVRDHYRELRKYENPTPQFKAQIAAELDAGKMPEINLVKISEVWLDALSPYQGDRPRATEQQLRPRGQDLYPELKEGELRLPH